MGATAARLRGRVSYPLLGLFAGKAKISGITLIPDRLQNLIGHISAQWNSIRGNPYPMLFS